MIHLLSIGTLPVAMEVFPAHRHESHWELIYYTQGNGNLSAHGKTHPFAPGRLFCVPPKIIHEERALGGFNNFHLSVEGLELENALIVFDDNAEGDLHAMFSQMHRVFHLKQERWESVLDGLLHALHQTMLSWSGRHRNPYVERFESQLIANLSNCNFSVGQAMKDFPLAPDYFRILFRQETGLSPVQYLTQLRIRHAERLLAGGGADVRIGDIAYMCGYVDSFYFSRIFSKHVGVSPTHYAERARIEGAPPVC